MSSPSRRVSSRSRRCVAHLSLPCPIPLTRASSYLQETAQLESEAFVQRQKVALATEVKTVLDSWVRFEQQAKESEQADLVKTVVENVLKNLNNEKTQKEVLAGAIAEIERMSGYLSTHVVTD